MRLKKRQLISCQQKRYDFTQMDYALQDLQNCNKIKINRIDKYKDDFEYNDYYYPAIKIKTFRNKMTKILSD